MENKTLAKAFISALALTVGAAPTAAQAWEFNMCGDCGSSASSADEAAPKAKAKKQESKSPETEAVLVRAPRYVGENPQLVTAPANDGSNNMTYVTVGVEKAPGVIHAGFYQPFAETALTSDLFIGKRIPMLNPIALDAWGLTLSKEIFNVGMVAASFGMVAVMQQGVNATLSAARMQSRNTQNYNQLYGFNVGNSYIAATAATNQAAAFGQLASAVNWGVHNGAFATNVWNYVSSYSSSSANALSSSDVNMSNFGNSSTLIQLNANDRFLNSSMNLASVVPASEGQMLATVAFRPNMVRSATLAETAAVLALGAAA